jgi:hypothetical protein
MAPDEIQLRGGVVTKDARLDRIPHFDQRSLQFRAADALPMQRDPRTYMWDCAQILDQGQEGACVGFGWTYELIAEPFPTTGLTDDTARALYHRAKQLDDQPGEDYEGTAVLAGAKTVHEQGYLDEYRWATTFQEILVALSYRGPVVFGINWYQSMYEPGPDGILHVDGEVAGGHCILGRGLNMERQAIVLRNSWGDSWGGGGDLGKGDAYLSFTDLQRLMHESGEACVPTVRE